MLNIKFNFICLQKRMINPLTSKHYTAYGCGFTEFLYSPPSKDLIHANEVVVY
jgi:hypothetical protein